MYIKKLETLSSERRAFKTNARKHKLAQLGLMENVGLDMQPILAEQERMCKAIESLQDNNIKHMEETTPKSKSSFKIHSRLISGTSTRTKSIRPVFSQDGFKIGKAYIEGRQGMTLDACS